MNDEDEDEDDNKWIGVYTQRLQSGRGRRSICRCMCNAFVLINRL